MSDQAPLNEPGKKKSMINAPQYLPTEQEIEDQCRSIKSRWSAEEEQRRRWSKPDDGITLPEVRSDDLASE